MGSRLAPRVNARLGRDDKGFWGKRAFVCGVMGIFVATVGITTKRFIFMRRADALRWIPAFAGMTPKEKAGMTQKKENKWDSG
ncbi:MAG: hypothetical protein WC464_04490 [Bdellovibrionales bacterium]